MGEATLTVAPCDPGLLCFAALARPDPRTVHFQFFLLTVRVGWHDDDDDDDDDGDGDGRWFDGCLMGASTSSGMDAGLMVV